ncbi:MAG: hypothetical protein KA928_02355 [Longilinea sp.]|nr:hypothetical protein [Longilinea sp.]HQF62531.1 hypothetical protein [Anaerolineaceae bacterium]HQH85687.1 hypothetical protein [Anaerolineaceae bacterium]
MSDKDPAETVPSRLNQSQAVTRPTLLASSPLETLPVKPEITEEPPASPPAEIEPPTAEPPAKPRRSRWFWLGLLIVLLAAALSAWVGYRAGIARRLAAEQEQRVMLASIQYGLAMQDIESGRLDAARQRLEYVIETDPTFPDAQQKLMDVMLAQAQLKTPTPAPILTPTPQFTPTPDLRGEVDLYQSVLNHMAAQEWDAALTTLDQLRDTNLNYRTVDVDGLYYICLRFRGAQRILYEGNLELGVYDLTLSEQFSQLDEEALGYRNWARYYMAGASFWRVDWVRVINYFSDIVPYVPNLRDSSGYTAGERYRLALIGYGDQLAAAGDYCEAQKQYEEALTLAPDPVLQPTLQDVVDRCERGEGEEDGGEDSPPAETPPPDSTPTETPPTEVPTEVPTEIPGVTPTP